MHITDQAMIHRRSRFGALFVCFALMLTWAIGCSRFHGGVPAEYVYVTVKRMYLRDRVAVVANRVATVTNGERLRVLEHGRHFLKVQTPQGNVGWLELHAVIDQSEFDKFQELAKEHAKQPAVATAVLFSEMYTHISPGRKSQRFYIFPENTKVSLLVRASVPRNPPSSLAGLPPAPITSVKASGRVHKQSFEKQFLPAVPMEDWWLVRDSTGRTGWMLSRDLQVDVPQEVAQYAENEKMVGAYVLRMVSDPDSGKPGGQVPEYLTVLTPYKDGLPFDFDQVRVFTWDVRRHRYGTAFRLHDVAGFFPVTVVPVDPRAAGGPSPEFSFQQAVDNAVSLDPVTGISHANQLDTITYRLEGNLVRRVLPAGEKASPNEARVRNARSVRRRRHTHSH